MMSDNIDEHVKILRNFAMKDNWMEVLRMYDVQSKLRTEKITPTGDTVLHMGVSRGTPEVVRNMVRILESEESATARENGDEKKRILGAKNEKGNTPLHLAASASKWGSEMCRILLGKGDSYLITIPNRNGETPLFMAALHGNRDAFHSLNIKSCDTDSSTPYRNHDNDTILHCAIKGGHIDLALEIVILFRDGLEEMATMQNKNGLRPLHLLAATPSAFESTDLPGRPFLFQLLYRWNYNWFRGIRKLKEKHTWSLQIMELLFQFDSSKEDVTANPYIVASEAAGSQIVDTPLMIAAQNGVIEMVNMFLEKYPSSVKFVNEKGKNIVLLAAEKRQTNLYRFLYEHLDKSAFSQVDKDGNTALHLAAMLGPNLNMQTTTMIEEFKWFDLVKSSVPDELREKYNNDWKTAGEIFRESYKELMTSDRQWLNQTSQTCSLASTLVASMAFSNFAGENIDKKNYSSLVALSLSLTSTICFLAILSFRSHSRHFWKYVPFMLHLAILTMIGSIVALWISLMVHGKSLTTYAILGSPIAILAIVSLPIFIGRTLMSTFVKVPPPNRSTTSAIRYRRPPKKTDETDFDRYKKSTPNYPYEANDSLQDIGSSRGRARIKRRHT